jgi:hypothetical protein
VHLLLALNETKVKLAIAKGKRSLHSTATHDAEGFLNLLVIKQVFNLTKGAIAGELELQVFI